VRILTDTTKITKRINAHLAAARNGTGQLQLPDTPRAAAEMANALIAQAKREVAADQAALQNNLPAQDGDAAPLPTPKPKSPSGPEPQPATDAGGARKGGGKNRNAPSNLTPGSSLTKADLLKAAVVPDRGGLTAAGRSLTKHGGGARPGNALFPAATGNPAAINQQAKAIVEEILNNPATKFTDGFRGRFGKTVEAVAPDGRGLVFDANGKFLFFKE
jgi:hypothetical protein